MIRIWRMIRRMTRGMTIIGECGAEVALGSGCGERRTVEREMSARMGMGALGGSCTEKGQRIYQVV